MRDIKVPSSVLNRFAERLHGSKYDNAKKSGYPVPIIFPADTAHGEQVRFVADESKEVEAALHDLSYVVLDGEEARTYLYPGGDEVQIENPVRLSVRPSGNHRVVAADGTGYILKDGWIAIEILFEDGKSFTF